MRLLAWNIAYGTGGPHSFAGQLGRVHNYLRTSPRHIQRVTDTIRSVDPDVSALVEVDMGSFRSRFINQAKYVADHLGQNWMGESKYGVDAWSLRIPILRRQGNAVISRLPMQDQHLYYMPKGMKKLVIDVDFERFRLVVVHLALTRHTREHQLNMLSQTIPKDKPIIICGDFNTLSRSPELIEFKRSLELYSFNETFNPTFPAFRPDKELDYILASHAITLNRFEILPVTYSDHCPLLADFSI